MARRTITASQLALGRTLALAGPVATLLLACGAAHGARIDFVLHNPALSQTGATVDARPGDTIVASAVISSPAGPTTGLAGSTFQISVTNWDATDTLAPWSTPSSSQNALGPGVDPTSGLGRVAPFGTANAAATPIVTTITDGIVIGGTGAGGGIAVGQLTRELSTFGTTNFFNASISPTVFRFSFTVGGTHSPGEFMALDAINMANNRVSWYLGETSANRAETLAAGDFGQGRVNIIVPAPGSFACLVGLGWITRRRR